MDRQLWLVSLVEPQPLSAHAPLGLIWERKYPEAAAATSGHDQAWPHSYPSSMPDDAEPLVFLRLPPVRMCSTQPWPWMVRCWSGGVSTK